MTAGSGYKNDGYDGDSPVKRPYSDDTASIQREKVKLARSEKWRILKNIGTVSVAFMVQFTAFQVCVNSRISEGQVFNIGWFFF